MQLPTVHCGSHRVLHQFKLGQLPHQKGQLIICVCSIAVLVKHWPVQGFSIELFTCFSVQSCTDWTAKNSFLFYFSIWPLVVPVGQPIWHVVQSGTCIHISIEIHMWSPVYFSNPAAQHVIVIVTVYVCTMKSGRGTHGAKYNYHGQQSRSFMCCGRSLN